MPLPSLERLVPLSWAITCFKGRSVAFGASAEHPNISHRPQRSVPEDFSAPLELSQPLSRLVDGSISHPFPSLPSPPLVGERGPREGTQVQPQGLLISNSICSGLTGRFKTSFSLPPIPFSLFRLWDPTQAPMATRASTPPLPGPAAQAGWTRHS